MNTDDETSHYYFSSYCH